MPHKTTSFDSDYMWFLSFNNVETQKLIGFVYLNLIPKKVPLGRKRNHLQEYAKNQTNQSMQHILSSLGCPLSSNWLEHPRTCETFLRENFFKLLTFHFWFNHFNWDRTISVKLVSHPISIPISAHSQRSQHFRFINVVSVRQTCVLYIANKILLRMNQSYLSK